MEAEAWLVRLLLVLLVVMQVGWNMQGTMAVMKTEDWKLRDVRLGRSNFAKGDIHLGVREIKKYEEIEEVITLPPSAKSTFKLLSGKQKFFLNESPTRRSESCTIGVGKELVSDYGKEVRFRTRVLVELLEYLEEQEVEGGMQMASRVEFGYRVTLFPGEIGESLREVPRIFVLIQADRAAYPWLEESKRFINGFKHGVRELYEQRVEQLRQFLKGERRDRPTWTSAGAFPVQPQLQYDPNHNLIPQLMANLPQQQQQQQQISSANNYLLFPQQQQQQQQQQQLPQPQQIPNANNHHHHYPPPHCNKLCEPPSCVCAV